MSPFTTFPVSFKFGIFFFIVPIVISFISLKIGIQFVRIFNGINDIAIGTIKILRVAKRGRFKIHCRF